ncbi:hypothetical protein [Cohnella caldifontis]|uniref:hypothetical protein n=1 Tax=Cohnella caldifontis TaxID=3027471 RepID=UPI0023ECF7B6|nr:hypothetical protein [Cohnella sp. YIM B05605]
MSRFGDWLLLLIAAGALAWLIVRRLDRWLHESPDARLRRLAKDGGVIPDEAVTLLQDNGFEVLTGKHRIPLGVSVDEEPSMSTRLFFDYLVSKDGKYYLVKLERARQPTEWTASGLRERLLVYALLFPGCEGILVADPKDGWVRMVRFHVEDGDE